MVREFFGAKPGMRANVQPADMPGANLSFAKTGYPTVTTKGRVLDHIGFDVKNLDAFMQNLEAAGMKPLDRAVHPEPEERRIALVSSPIRGAPTSS